MEDLKKVWLAASGAFAALPGLAIIITGLGVPPGQKAIFGGVIEAFGALTLLIIWANRANIREWSKTQVTRRSLIAACGSLLMLVAYIGLYGHTIVENPSRGTAYFPLYLSGDIDYMVAMAGSREAAIGRYGIDAIQEALDAMPDTAFSITTVTLLLLYQALFTLFAFAFGILGLKDQDTR